VSYTALFRGIAASEHLTFVRQALKELASASLEEPGTIRYDFYQNQGNPTEFLLLGVWKSEIDWQAHLAGRAHSKYVASLPEGAWEVPPAQTRLTPLE
jgi:quinol monooxygenase YgiN